MPSAEHRLGLRTLFIVPSRFGILWLGAALLLLLVGIQTSSNSSLLLGFLLLGLMLLVRFGLFLFGSVRFGLGGLGVDCPLLLLLFCYGLI